MKIFSTIYELQQELKALRLNNLTVGLVPTMGNLHEGHLSLVRKSKKATDITVATIFVNPSQFDNNNDLANYPRTEKEDALLLEQQACDILFTPTVSEVYQQKTSLTFSFGHLDKVLEGKFRNGHFSGVATIVTKLFHWVNPDYAFFGQKDLQQFKIIETLVNDLSFPIKLEMCPIKREDNGLAMSSRNSRLSTEERNKAAILYQALKIIFDAFQEKTVKEAKNEALLLLDEKKINVEYLEIVSKDDLQSSEDKNKKLVACIAAYVGEVRLIDNFFLN